MVCPGVRLLSRILLLSAICTGGVGCATQGSTENGKENVTYHIGVTRVVNKDVENSSGIRMYAIDTAGIRGGDGIGIGYFHEWRVLLPSKCQIVFLIRTTEEMKETIKWLDQHKGDELCATTLPES